LSRVQPAEWSGDLIGLISPHAGYVYSGQTAAYAYARVQTALSQGSQFDLVVVLSPAHSGGYSRFSITTASAYETPLGTVELDHRAVEALSQQIEIQRIGRDTEHAIEVQLPFLQVALDSFTLLPVMIGILGSGSGEELGSALSDILADRQALIVASSDLHHIHNYKQVVRRDNKIVEDIVSMDMARIKQSFASPDCTVCGSTAIVAMLTAAIAAGANRVNVLCHTNSRDASGIRPPDDYTVGYMAAAALRE
jgi:AmmeMemoRadiSam system protein B